MVAHSPSSHMCREPERGVTRIATGPYDLTRAAMQAAMREFNELGREDFLSAYGFGPGARYYVVDHGRRYDMKPLVAAAVGKLAPGGRPLRPPDINSGRELQQLMETLGFATEVARPPG